ncbi:hypothetical protein LX36DRAFT_25850 [Colletotrichum falcatum]|nr:hypothetical protein LX36DRAFT_25850 [Colletotrichum falcatum]
MDSLPLTAACTSRPGLVPSNYRPGSCAHKGSLSRLEPLPSRASSSDDSCLVPGDHEVGRPRHTSTWHATTMHRCRAIRVELFFACQESTVSPCENKTTIYLRLRESTSGPSTRTSPAAISSRPVPGRPCSFLTTSLPESHLPPRVSLVLCKFTRSYPYNILRDT